MAPQCPSYIWCLRQVPSLSHLHSLDLNPSPKIQTRESESRQEARLEERGMRDKQNSTSKSGLQGRGDLSLSLPRCVPLKQSASFANYSMSLIFFLRCFLKIGTSIAPSSSLQNCNHWLNSQNRPAWRIEQLCLPRVQLLESCHSISTSSQEQIFS